MYAFGLEVTFDTLTTCCHSDNSCGFTTFLFNYLHTCVRACVCMCVCVCECVCVCVHTLYNEGV